jgi:NDP-sugar pyrophosphorylase family protein
MTATARSLILSHTAVLLTGFAIGKWMDYGELETYRRANESWFRRWQRNAAAISFSVMVMGGVVMVLRSSRNQAYANV